MSRRLIYLYLLTAAALVLSLLKDAGKTRKALNVAWTRFAKILPSFLLMLALVSILLALLPEQVIAGYLGGSGRWAGLALGSVLGSLSMLPGFIAFPLSGLLVQQGVSYMAVAGFTTTLMMVGVATFPVEQRYFGARAALWRNLISFGIALVVALCVGLAYGEVL